VSFPYLEIDRPVQPMNMPQAVLWVTEMFGTRVLRQPSGIAFLTKPDEQQAEREAEFQALRGMDPFPVALNYQKVVHVVTRVFYTGFWMECIPHSRDDSSQPHEVEDRLRGMVRHAHSLLGAVMMNLPNIC
jgi:hypothetical protein